MRFVPEEIILGVKRAMPDDDQATYADAATLAVVVAAATVGKYGDSDPITLAVGALLDLIESE